MRVDLIRRIFEYELIKKIKRAVDPSQHFITKAFIKSKAEPMSTWNE